MSDHAAFPDDLTHHAAALRRVALAVVGDESAADDAVQSAYLSALERGPAAPGWAWMVRTVRSRALDLLRRGRARRDHERLHGGPRPLAGAGEIAERVETYRVLSDAIARLPEAQQQVLYLRYFEGLSPARIAQRTGIPVKTVKTRLARALARMRALLGRRLGGGREGLGASLLLPLGLPAPRAPGAGGASGGSLAGGLVLMSKKLSIALAVLALLVASYLVLSGDDPAPAAGLGAGAPAEPDRPRAGAELAGAPPAEPTEGATDRVAVTAAEAPEEPAAPPAGPEPGSLLVRVLRASGDPVAGVEVYVKRDAEGETWDGLARLRTDAAGEARLDRVAPSTVQVGPLREFYDNHTDVAIEPGREAVAELTVADGITLQGRVVDGLGQPVPGAEIWVATGIRYWLGGEVVGTADQLGEFQFEGVDPGTGVGAIAPGFERSAVVDLDRVVKTAGIATVELELAREGGAVTGRVVDPQGEPVEGAWVAIGEPVRYFDWHGSGGIAEEWTPMTARTDAGGAFTIHGLPRTTHPVEVKAAGFALWKAEVAVGGRSPAPLFVELNRGFSVAGTVRDERGEPVPGAIVRAYDEELRTDFIQGGQFDYYSAFGFGKTRTDLEGHYRLDHLRLVPTHLWATPEPRPRRSMGEGVIRAHAVVHGQEGEVVRWDPTLGEGLVLHGKVTYSGGEPMPDVFITARHDGSGTEHILVTGREGGFRFTNMVEGPHSIGVQLWDPPEGTGPLQESLVHPGPEPVLLVADFPKPDEEEPGEVTGLVVDEAGRLEDPLLLRVILRWKSGFIWNENANLDGARFTFRDVEPGEYRVCAFSGDTLIHQTDWFELWPAEYLDLGELKTAPGGSILLTVDGGSLGEEVVPRFSTGLKGEINSVDFEPEPDGPTLLDNLEPGTHRVRAWGEGLAGAEVEVRVSAGVVAEATLRLRPAARREFSVAWPAGAELAYLHVSILEADGNEIWDVRESNVGALPNPYERWARLPLGEFVLKADTGTDLSGSLAFSVTDLAAQQEPVELHLH